MDSLSAVLFFFFYSESPLGREIQTIPTSRSAHSLDSAYPHEYYYPNQWGMKPSLDTLFIVQMTNQKQGQQGRLGQHFSLSRPRTCADESIESAVLAVPH